MLHVIFYFDVKCKWFCMKQYLQQRINKNKTFGILIVLKRKKKLTCQDVIFHKRHLIWLHIIQMVCMSVYAEWLRIYFKFKYQGLSHGLNGSMKFYGVSNLSADKRSQLLCTLPSFLMLRSFLLFLEIYDLLITWESETHCISTVDPLLVHKSKSS